MKENRQKKRGFHRKKQSWDDMLYSTICGVFLIGLVIIVFYPLWFVLVASVSNPLYVNRGDFLLFPKGFNMLGYEKVFHTKKIWSGYANTLLYTVCGTALGTVVTVMAGYAFSRKDLPGRGLLMKAFIFTMYFSGGMIPLYMTVKNLGLINNRLVLIVMGVVSTYNIIVVRSFMESNIPDELLDAATIDGCGNGRFFTRIVVPLSRAVVSVIVLYIAVEHWNSYFPAMLYMTDEKKYPLQLVLREILMSSQTAINNAEFLDAQSAAEMQNVAQVMKYALIVVSTAPIICVYPFIQKYFTKGVMIGSVKG